MISIRGGMGLGDALYVQAVARHLVSQGECVEACSKWPDVFRPLNEGCIVSPFRRERIDRLAHYSLRRRVTKTDQFEDCCIQAGVGASLRLDWIPVNADLIESVRRRANDRRVLLVQLPRLPMDRVDGYGDELLPRCEVIQAAISHLGPDVYVVQVGRGDQLFRFDGIDLDLANRTSVVELLDLAYAADCCLGYVSFLVPLAESLGKPALMVWSRRGLQSRNEVIRQLTPRKVIHRRDLVRHVVDDCSEEELHQATRALLAEARGQAVV